VAAAPTAAPALQRNKHIRIKDKIYREKEVKTNEKLLT
jgi:hypothetical protein